LSLHPTVSARLVFPSSSPLSSKDEEMTPAFSYHCDFVFDFQTHHLFAFLMSFLCFWEDHQHTGRRG
jgi:hypothetical protein